MEENALSPIKTKVQDEIALRLYEYKDSLLNVSVINKLTVYITEKVFDALGIDEKQEEKLSNDISDKRKEESKKVAALLGEDVEKIDNYEAIIDKATTTSSDFNSPRKVLQRHRDRERYYKNDGKM